MATEESESTEGTVVQVYQTVTPPYRGRSNEEMNLVGYLLIGGLLILLIPLGPFLLAFWLLSKVWDAVGQRGDSD
jgi:hypothetical protein